MNRLAIAVPASVVSDTPHLREKTAKIGVIGRAASIFGVDDIILYPDDPRVNQEAEMAFCGDILRYLETPQYLRKRMFKLSPEFRFTGILAPLQTPHHNVPRDLSQVRTGDLREGVVVSRAGHELKVDAGLEDFVSATGHQNAGERVTLRMVNAVKNLTAEILDDKTIRPESHSPQVYWGYRVRSEKSLGKLLRDGRWGLRLGTSRYGVSIREVFPSITKRLNEAKETLVAFGSPKMGLKEILAAENLAPNDAFHYFVNMVPDQQTVTVRAEEALLISLGILNMADSRRRREANAQREAQD